MKNFDFPGNSTNVVFKIFFGIVQKNKCLPKMTFWQTEWSNWYVVRSKSLIDRNASRFHHENQYPERIFHLNKWSSHINLPTSPRVEQGSTHRDSDLDLWLQDVLLLWPSNFVPRLANRQILSKWTEIYQSPRLSMFKYSSGQESVWRTNQHNYWTGRLTQLFND